MFWPRLGLEPFSAFSLRRLLHLVGTTIKWKVILCILPLLPALTGAVLRVAPVGRRERKQARTWGWLASAIRTVGQRLAQSFPSILLQSDKGSGVHLPCLSVRAPSFLFDFSAVPRGRGAVLHTQTPLGATATLGSLSRDAAPPPAAWGGPGVRPGRRPQAEPEFGYPSQVCTGAIPARSALETVAVHLQRGPLAVHFQDVHPGVAAWNQSSDVVCPTGSAWQLPGPVAL